MKSRKKITQALCILAASVMMLSLAGCGGGNSSGGGNTQGSDTSSSQDANAPLSEEKKIKIEYKTEKIPVPGDSDYIQDFTASDDKIYYTTTKYNYDEDTGISSNETKINCIDLSGKLISSDVISCDKLSEDDNANITNIKFRPDGSIWYVESHEFYNEETEESISVPYLKHRSADGEELFSADLSKLPVAEEQDYFYISNYAIDDEGRIGLIVGSDYVVALDKDGKQLFATNEITDSANSWINGIVKSKDGRMYVLVNGYDMDAEGNYSMTNLLKVINFDEKKMDDGFAAPSNASGLLEGNDKYPILYTGSQALYGLKEDGTSDEIINWLNCGVDASYVNNVSFLGDDYIIPPTGYDEGDGGMFFQRIKKLDESEVKEKILVSLAAYYLSDSVRSAILEFNENNADYAIQVTDYSIYNDYSSEDSYNAGMTKLNTEITSGNIPDILCISDIEYFENYGKKGLLADINTFIDNDPDYNRDDYCDSILKGIENSEGKLYAYPTNYYIAGFAAKKKYIPNDGAVSIDDFLAARKDGMAIYSSDADRKSFLQVALIFGINSFVNTDTGECNLNCDEFKKILELSKEFPEEVDWAALNSDPDYWNNYEMQYRNDKTLAYVFTIYNYEEINRIEQATFGEEVSLFGMPGTNEGPAILPSSLISVSASSPHPEAGWQLIKSSVSEERQSKNDWDGFPMNKAARTKFAEKQMKPQTYTDENGVEQEVDNTYMMGDISVTIERPTQAVIDRINGLADNSSCVMLGTQENIADIIYEEAANYYNGQNTVDQAAEMIQSRVQIYLSEQQ